MAVEAKEKLKCLPDLKFVFEHIFLRYPFDLELSILMFNGTFV